MQPLDIVFQYFRRTFRQFGVAALVLAVVGSSLVLEHTELSRGLFHQLDVGGLAVYKPIFCFGVGVRVQLAVVPG